MSDSVSDMKSCEVPVLKVECVRFSICCGKLWCSWFNNCKMYPAVSAVKDCYVAVSIIIKRQVQNLLWRIVNFLLQNCKMSVSVCPVKNCEVSVWKFFKRSFSIFCEKLWSSCCKIVLYHCYYLLWQIMKFLLKFASVYPVKIYEVPASIIENFNFGICFE